MFKVMVPLMIFTKIEAVDDAAPPKPEAVDVLARLWLLLPPASCDLMPKSVTSRPHCVRSENVNPHCRQHGYCF